MWSVGSSVDFLFFGMHSGRLYWVGLTTLNCGFLYFLKSFSVSGLMILVSFIIFVIKRTH